MNIQEIKKHPENKIFFNNAKFHGDTGYKIGKLQGKDTLEVKTNHGLVRYFLHNDGKIGELVRLEDLK